MKNQLIAVVVRLMGDRLGGQESRAGRARLVSLGWRPPEGRCRAGRSLSSASQLFSFLSLFSTWRCVGARPKTSRDKRVLDGRDTFDRRRLPRRRRLRMSEQFNQSAADAFARSGLPTLPSSGVKRSRVQSLHDAVEQYDMNALRGLVITGAPLTEVDDLNCTPLHNAVEPDCPEEAALEMVKIMLASSPDEEERIEALCARSDEGLTPLHMVVKRGSVKLSPC